MEKISAVICTYNEEHNMRGLIESLKDCDEIIIADDGSTDNTRELAEKLGATVYLRNKYVDIATQEDVIAYQDRFGWLPQFSENETILNMGGGRNEAISKSTGDWIFMPDADERVSWDIEEIRGLMEISDMIQCMFIHSHEPNGDPRVVFPMVKMFRKGYGVYKGRVHEIAMPSGRIAFAEYMKIDHLQKDGHKQIGVLSALEYSVLKDNTIRDKFYLGREYYYHKEYGRAINIFDEYLEESTWLPEIVEALYIKAKCLWESQRGDEARKACLKAINGNPDHRASLRLMSTMHFEPWKSKWKYIADNATNKDSLF